MVAAAVIRLLRARTYRWTPEPEQGYCGRVDSQRCGKSARVEVVVVHFRRPELTRLCLCSLAAQSHASLGVVLVDNGSPDNSGETLAREFPGVKVIRCAENLGYAGGCNRAVREVLTGSASYVWLLNNDTTPGPSALEAMVQVAESAPRVGAVGSMLLDVESGSMRVWGGGRVSLLTGISREVSRPQPPQGPTYLSGASLLIRREALERVGFLDEEFFMYWEDADLCYRLRRAGWGLAVAERSLVGHHEGASSGFLTPAWDRQFVLSSWRFFRRHAPLPLLPFLTGAIVRAALRARHGRWNNVSAIVGGIGDAFAGHRVAPGMGPEEPG